MRAWPLILLVALSGCLTFDYEYENDSPDGAFALEGRVASGSLWDRNAHAIIPHPDTFVEPSSGSPGAGPLGEPLAQPGGGQEHTLELPVISTSFEVRALRIKGVLDWYVFPVTTNPFVDDYALHFSVADGDPVQRLPGNATFTFEADAPGIYAILAYGDAGRSDIFYATVDVAWSVEGQVYPSRTANSAPPDGYAEMADRYAVHLPAPLPGFHMATAGVQDDRYFVGTDIDVGLWAADGTAIACTGDDTADEDLTESIPVTVYDVVYAIGAMPDSCGQNWSYTNNGPVQYTATLQTSYSLAV